VFLLFLKNVFQAPVFPLGLREEVARLNVCFSLFWCEKWLIPAQFNVKTPVKPVG